MAHAIGTTVWHRGYECRVTTEPYEGGMWQDAVNLETGKAVTLPTPEAVAARVVRDRAAHQALQDGFRRLRESA